MRDGAGGPRVRGGASRLVLPFHVAGLTLVLLALVPVLDDGLFSADEGAALAQVDVLERTGDWTLPNPDPALDPEAEALPVENAFRSADGRWAPFAKHAVYITLLRAAHHGGRTGTALLGVGATVVAAAAAGVLASRLLPGSAGAAVWVAGLATPLLFDAYLVMGHSVGAAAVACAAVAAERAVNARSVSLGTMSWATSAFGFSCLAGLVRTEGLLAALALAGAASLAALLRGRAGVVHAIVVGIILGAAAPVAYLVTKSVDRRAWGEAIGSYLAGVRERPSWLTGRYHGLRTTWLHPGAMDGIVVLTLVGVTLLWAGALLARRRRADPGGISLFAVAGAGLVALRFVDADTVVPGLLVATPVLAGLVGWGRADLRNPTFVLLGSATLAFAALVLLTQYAEGGSGEWGGRYFALGLPLVVPLGVAGWYRLVERAPAARPIAAGVAVASLVLAVCSVITLDSIQERGTRIVERVDEIRREVGGGEPAPVLATAGTIARFSWEHLDEGSWHTVATEDLAVYAERLRERGAPIVLFTTAADRDLPRVEPFFVAVPLAGETVYRLDPR